MVSSLSLPPLNLFIVNFFTFSLFFLFLHKNLDEKKNIIFFFYGWSFGFGFFLTNLYWISISLTFDQNFKLLIPFTIILIPAFLALFYGLISLVFAIFNEKKIISSFLLFSLIFGLAEYLRGNLFTGFPWNLIVFSFSNQLEFLSIISIIGTFGMNLFCITLFTCPALVFLGDYKKNFEIPVFLFLLCLTFYYYGSLYKNRFNNLDENYLDYKIRVIGSNITLERFYSSDDPVSIIKELIDLSEAKKDEKIIFVWPEGILPGVNQLKIRDYSRLFKENFNQNHLLIIGINRDNIVDGSINYYNSLALFDNNLNLLNSYNKINLVPFGEFLPFDKILSKIGLKSLTNNYKPFSSGDKREIIKIENKDFVLKFLPLICYEIIYSGKLFNSSNFDLIINISEDGWFGNSVGPKQHFAHSTFRAIESGKYIIRSTNNGSAAIINPLGIIEDRVKFNTSGYVELEKIKKNEITIFSKFGNKIFGILILLYILVILLFNKIRNE